MNQPDRNFNPRAPSGSDDEARRFIVTHEQLHPMRRAMPTRPPQQFPPNRGKFWMYPDHREGDPTFSYDADTWMYLTPGNPLVTTGMIDLVSGLRAFSKPGFWQAGSNVPAQVVVSGVTKWNVPVYPYPGATGTPTGSPLKGDLDLGQFWIYHGQLVC